MFTCTDCGVTIKYKYNIPRHLKKSCKTLLFKSTSKKMVEEKINALESQLLLAEEKINILESKMASDENSKINNEDTNIIKQTLASEQTSLDKYNTMLKEYNLTDSDNIIKITEEKTITIKKDKSQKSSFDSTKSKRNITEAKKKLVVSKQSWKCNHCNELLDNTYEVDHIIPLYKGGDNTIDNLQGLCRNCHGKKTSLDKFVEDSNEK